MKRIVLVVHNVRSCHNVGSLLRTAEGLGVLKVYMSGFTPYPQANNDHRLPHISQRAASQIAKTSLGAEKTMPWETRENLSELVRELKQSGFKIAALEQAKNSVLLNEFRNPDDIALLVGSETTGLEPEALKLCDLCLEIPMSGKKESFNVAVAAAIGLYHLKFSAKVLDKKVFRV